MRDIPFWCSGQDLNLRTPTGKDLESHSVCIDERKICSRRLASYLMLSYSDLQNSPIFRQKFLSKVLIVSESSFVLVPTGSKMERENRKTSIRKMTLLLFLLSVVILVIYAFAHVPSDSQKNVLSFDAWIEQTPAVIKLYITNKNADVHNVIVKCVGRGFEGYPINEWFTYEFDDQNYGNLPSGATAVLPYFPHFSDRWTDVAGYPFDTFNITIGCAEGTFKATLK